MDKKGFGEQDLDTKSKHFTCCIKLQQRHSAFIAFFHINNTHMNIHECSDTKKPLTLH